MDGNSRRREVTIAWVLLGFSALYLVGSLRLEIGTTRNPGPGFFPIVMGVLLTVCTGIYGIRVIRKRTEGEKPAPAAGGKNYRALAAIIGSGIFYPLILGTLKFVVSTFVVTFIMLYLMKSQRPVSCLLLALAMALASFMIFSRILGVGLPMGPIEIFLFNLGG